MSSSPASSQTGPAAAGGSRLCPVGFWIPPVMETIFYSDLHCNTGRSLKWNLLYISLFLVLLLSLTEKILFLPPSFFIHPPQGLAHISNIPLELHLWVKQPSYLRLSSCVRCANPLIRDASVRLIDLVHEILYVNSSSWAEITFGSWKPGLTSTVWVIRRLQMHYFWGRLLNMWNEIGINRSLRNKEEKNKRFLKFLLGILLSEE